MFCGLGYHLIGRRSFGVCLSVSIYAHRADFSDGGCVIQDFLCTLREKYYGERIKTFRSEMGGVRC